MKEELEVLCKEKGKKVGGKVDAAPTEGPKRPGTSMGVGKGTTKIGGLSSGLNKPTSAINKK